MRGPCKAEIVSCTAEVSLLHTHVQHQGLCLKGNGMLEVAGCQSGVPQHVYLLSCNIHGELRMDSVTWTSKAQELLVLVKWTDSTNKNVQGRTHLQWDANVGRSNSSASV